MHRLLRPHTPRTHRHSPFALTRSPKTRPTQDSLAYERLAGFQGPALLAYNDAVFTQDDFTSISRVGDSVKRTQIGKTGRFGIGFNSVYHLTDVPSFGARGRTADTDCPAMRPLRCLPRCSALASRPLVRVRSPLVAQSRSALSQEQGVNRAAFPPPPRSLLYLQ